MAQLEYHSGSPMTIISNFVRSEVKIQKVTKIKRYQEFFKIQSLVEWAFDVTSFHWRTLTYHCGVHPFSETSLSPVDRCLSHSVKVLKFSSPLFSNVQRQFTSAFISPGPVFYCSELIFKSVFVLLQKKIKN